MEELVGKILEVLTPYLINTNIFSCSKGLHLYSLSKLMEGYRNTHMSHYYPIIHNWIPKGDDNVSCMTKCNLVIVINRSCQEFTLVPPCRLPWVFVSMIGRWAINDVVHIHPYITPNCLIYHKLSGYNFATIDCEKEHKERDKYIDDVKEKFILSSDRLLLGKGGYNKTELIYIYEVLGIPYTNNGVLLIQSIRNSVPDSKISPDTVSEYELDNDTDINTITNTDNINNYIPHIVNDLDDHKINLVLQGKIKGAYTKKELVSMCRIRGLNISGTKKILVMRLLDYHK